ncbi:MAG: right-handed parallel beta-helix repeat-containing protein [Fimbriimonas sp.]
MAGITTTLAISIALAAGTQRTAPAPRAIFVAPSGDDANPGTADRPFRTIQRGADAAGPGDTVTVRGGTYPEAVRLTKSGRYFNRPITLTAAAGETVALKALDTGGQDHLTLRGLTIRNATGVGLLVQGSYRVRVEGVRTENTPLSGILIDKSHDVVVSKCDVSKACVLGGEESLSVKRSADVVVEDSEVHHTFHEGIDIKEGSRHVVVRRNRVHHVERQGLYADAWDAVTGDIRFENNIVHNCMVGLVACTETGGLLYNVTFAGNVVYDCKGPGMMLAKWGDARKGHRIQRVAFLNNTVVNCGGGGARGDWSGGLLLENDQAEDVLVANNILSGNPYAQLRVTLGLTPKRMTIRNNLIDGPGENLTRGNFVKPPRFVDAAAKDFRLAPDSPAIDAGHFLPEIGAVDAAATPRLKGRRIDIGAYER